MNFNGHDPMLQRQRYPDSKNGNSIEQGLEFQDFAMDVLREAGFFVQVYSSKRYQVERGESAQGWEFKLDNRCTETQRLSIEVAERTSVQREWRQSGIYSDPPSLFYVQGNPHQFFAFATHTLIWCRGKFNLTVVEQPKESPTVRAFYIPLESARNVAFFVYEETP